MAASPKKEMNAIFLITRSLTHWHLPRWHPVSVLLTAFQIIIIRLLRSMLLFLIILKVRKDCEGCYVCFHLELADSRGTKPRSLPTIIVILERRLQAVSNPQQQGFDNGRIILINVRLTDDGMRGCIQLGHATSPASDTSERQELPESLDPATGTRQ